MRLRAHAVATAIVATALPGAAGCGGGGGHAGGRAPARTTATARAAAPTEPTEPKGTPADAATAAAVRAVGERYLQAMDVKDAAAACATRTPTERQQMAILGGSCAKAYRRIFAVGQSWGAGAATVVDVRLRGPYAVAAWEARGHRHDGRDALVARRVGGRWLLVDHDFAPTLTASGTVSARAIQRVANRFLHAVATRDWKTACATRTPRDRRQMADFSGGTCEDAMRVLARQTYAPGRRHAGRVTFDDAGRASVAVADVDGTSAESLTALRVGAAWLLQDSDDSADLP